MKHLSPMSDDGAQGWFLRLCVERMDVLRQLVFGDLAVIASACAANGVIAMDLRVQLGLAQALRQERIALPFFEAWQLAGDVDEYGWPRESAAEVLAQVTAYSDYAAQRLGFDCFDDVLHNFGPPPLPTTRLEALFPWT